MTILHLRASNFYGGPERQLYHHARVMASTDLRVIIGSYRENGKRPELLDVAEVGNVDNVLLNVKSAYDLSAIGKMRSVLRGENVDLLCTHDYRSHLLGHLACARSKVKHVCFMRGSTRDDLKVRLYQWLDRLTLGFADHIVTVSEQQRRALRGFSDERVSVAHNAVSIDELDEIEPVDLKLAFDLPPEALVVVAAGRFSNEKGQRFLIDAAAECIEQDRRFCFILFGDGPQLAELRHAVENSAYGSRIILPGFDKRVLGFLKTADILVNPSLSEGLPNVVLEAMAIGTPVIATSVGGVPEIIENERSGLLVNPGDAAVLSQRIVQLAEDVPLRRQLADSGREVVRRRFSFAQQAKTLIRIYEKVST